MDWSTLAPTLLGGALALGGGFLGQWWSERRAKDREERTREHEAFVWARAQRLEAHGRFLAAFNGAAKESDATGRVEQLNDFFGQLRAAADDRKLLCSKATSDATNHAWMTVVGHHDGSCDSDRLDVNHARAAYFTAIRAEFGLPAIERPAPPHLRPRSAPRPDWAEPTARAAVAVGPTDNNSATVAIGVSPFLAEYQARPRGPAQAEQPEQGPLVAASTGWGLRATERSAGVAANCGLAVLCRRAGVACVTDGVFGTEMGFLKLTVSGKDPILRTTVYGLTDEQAHLTPLDVGDHAGEAVEDEGVAAAGPRSAKGLGQAMTGRPASAATRTVSSAPDRRPSRSR